MLSDMIEAVTRGSLSFDEVQVVQLIVQQAVHSVEDLQEEPVDPSKVACAMVEDYLETTGVFAPPAFLEKMVEASFQFSRDSRIRNGNFAV